MVLVRLKGVHTVKATLASGKVAVYYYAWKGGPRLSGMPSAPEFTASYNQAHGARKQPTTGTLRDLITAWKASAEYEHLSEHTLRAYRRYLTAIQEEFGDLPKAALDDEEFVGDVLDWRDGMRASPRSADYALSTFSALLGWAKERRKIKHNHLTGLKRLHSSNRSDSIWSADDFATFQKKASKELYQAVMLAAYTGLRQGDLITLTWRDYDAASQSFMIRTSKRGKVVIIPATAECRNLLTEIKRRQIVILTTHRGGRKWTSDGLRASFNQARKDALITRTFHDLRRTAATRLLSAGIAAPQVAMIMGWSEDEIEQLKLIYISRKAVMDSVLESLEGGG